MGAKIRNAMRHRGLSHRSRRSFSVTLLAAVTGACGTREKDKVQVLGKLTNARHGLICEFVGQAVGSGTASVSAIDRMIFRESKSGDWHEVVPADPETLRRPNGQFYPMWSPDETLFALPLGRLEGFRFIPGEGMLQALRQGTSRDEVHMQFDTGTRLWHEFIGWKDSSTFLFRAGPSGQLVPFSYDLAAGTLHCPKTVFAANFRGFTTKGEIEPTLTD
jgi:hypothetical protein